MELSSTVVEYWWRTPVLEYERVAVVAFSHSRNALPSFDCTAGSNLACPLSSVSTLPTETPRSCPLALPVSTSRI